VSLLLLQNWVKRSSFQILLSHLSLIAVHHCDEFARFEEPWQCGSKVLRVGKSPHCFPQSRVLDVREGSCNLAFQQGEPLRHRLGATGRNVSSIASILSIIMKNTMCSPVCKSDMPLYHRAHGVVVSHPLSMREALGSIPSVSIHASGNSIGFHNGTKVEQTHIT